MFRASSLALCAATFTLMLVAAPAAQAGLFNPHIDKYTQCAATTRLSGADLKSYSKSGSLYLYEWSAADRASIDYDIMRPLGISGFVFSSRTSPEWDELADSESILITGNLYVRDASIFEKILGGGSDTLLYELVAESQRYLLPVSELRRLPTSACAAVDLHH
tara:strand:+ start:205 stop:693 length:489 start_codon:yes stop_codon:yes gene_type:complete